MDNLPDDYLERVYAGVLGKLIGVYLGRPVEGWTHQEILAELGHIRYYVNEQLGTSIVVTDDDISGPFTFVRALEEHNSDTFTKNLPSPAASASIGRTWLNNVIKQKTVFWWGGNGVSTEQTAYLNLRKGIEAPDSGSILTNGKTIAEQIGAQIFIDGWAMVAAGDPELATNLAHAAASVSHDGESVHAAKLWAAMEAAAFLQSDVDELIDVGLNAIPSDSLIATLIRDVRSWCEEDDNWLRTRQRIEDKYGYDKFPGLCHVVPNHGIMIMTLIYASHDFHEAMHIVNTCGWDTDCNSGNVACLIAIMHGLKAFDNGPDWRGPVADRAFISSADGGYSINNAARIAYDIVNMRRKLGGLPPLARPKDGAQFHFSLPGSVQGFQLTSVPKHTGCRVKVKQAVYGPKKRTGLEICISGFGKTTGSSVEVMTDTFAPVERWMTDRYNLESSPLLYPGQAIRAVLRADKENTGAAQVQFTIKAYSSADELETLVGNTVTVARGKTEILKDVIPTNLGVRPVQSVGLTISSSPTKTFGGTIWLDSLGWDGIPKLTLRARDASYGELDFCKHSFVNGADVFSMSNGKFVVAQDSGEGLVSYGTREWTDYRAVFKKFTVNMDTPAAPAGAAIRVRGLNRYYALRFLTGASGFRVALVKAVDDGRRVELASAPFSWKIDAPYDVTLEAEGSRILARVGDEVKLEAKDDQYPGGGIGLVAIDASLLVESIEIGPLR
ncbi:ADP-ribosylation/Crystallin J1 [Hypoxylon rubiginosum]|uniref:ADP-ribosylation/Crystallin J1 n=1 Tax=Hypoxylon rubiginosum TaxID=110542 RepID=A0ACB9YWI0_9PEZI|nr:ADP-ribosylation/Crystallin J1 [Hypoxylon rubiginosum]